VKPVDLNSRWGVFWSVHSTQILRYVVAVYLPIRVPRHFITYITDGTINI
jgi:hypothetical protein